MGKPARIDIEMRKEQGIITELENKGYDIKRIEKANGGRNGSVFKLSTDNGKYYALKIIKSKVLSNGNSRAAQEAEFIKYLDFIDTGRHPKLKEYSAEENWILTEWKAGKRANNFDKENIEQVLQFIIDTNKKEYWKERSKLRDAIDSYKSVDNCIADVKNRLNILSKRPDSEGNQWINKTLKEFIRINIEDTLSRRPVDKKESWWIAKDNELIASPSDIGVHNTLEVEGRLYFFDFEYAGLDDMSKLICDLVLQPENLLSKELEKKILNIIGKEMENGNWLKRYEAIRSLNIAKWSLIILAGNGNKEMSSKKAEQYFYNAIKGRTTK